MRDERRGPILVRCSGCECGTLDRGQPGHHRDALLIELTSGDHRNPPCVLPLSFIAISSRFFVLTRRCDLRYCTVIPPSTVRAWPTT